MIQKVTATLLMVGKCSVCVGGGEQDQMCDAHLRNTIAHRICTHQPKQNQFMEARNALADFGFRWSTKTSLQTSTHSLQINTRLERSDGFEMSVSTWSWVLLQNEHLRISSSSWRLPNMIPVCRESSVSQDSQKLKWALLVELTLRFQRSIERCCALAAKRLLASAGQFCQSSRETAKVIYRSWRGSIPPLAAPVFPTFGVEVPASATGSTSL
jgi:hypothetical protein